jgi:hypothetical protein
MPSDVNPPDPVARWPRSARLRHLSRAERVDPTAQSPATSCRTTPRSPGSLFSSRRETILSGGYPIAGTRRQTSLSTTWHPGTSRPRSKHRARDALVCRPIFGSASDALKTGTSRYLAGGRGPESARAQHSPVKTAGPEYASRRSSDPLPTHPPSQMLLFSPSNRLTSA